MNGENNNKLCIFLAMKTVRSETGWESFYFVIGLKSFLLEILELLQG
jgi:hypothetical protein